MDWSTQERLPIALAGAVVLHLGGIVSARVYAPPASDTVAAVVESELEGIELEGIELDIEIEGGAELKGGAALAPAASSRSTLSPPLAAAEPADRAHAAATIQDAAPGPETAEPTPAQEAPDVSGNPWGDGSNVDWSDPVAEGGGRMGWGLSLPDRIALAPKSAPAPTRPRAPRALTEDDIEGGIRTAMRARDESIGLGGQEATIVTQAVKLAARAAPVPSGTRARFEIELDASGNVLSARISQFTHGNERMWGDVLAAFKGALGPGPIAVGVDAKKAGVRLQIDLYIVHALPGGSVDGVRVGECIAMPEEGSDRGTTRDMFSSSDFFAVGGGLYGDRASGTCTFGEDPTAKRHLEVRTTTRSIFPNAGPPPAATMPKPKKLLPWVPQ